MSHAVLRHKPVKCSPLFETGIGNSLTTQWADIGRDRSTVLRVAQLNPTWSESTFTAR